MEVEVFPPIVEIWRSKQNDIVELWKFSLKIRLLIKWGLGVGVVGKLIFRAEFKIQRTLLYLIIWSTFQKVI